MQIQHCRVSLVSRIFSFQIRVMKYRAVCSILGVLFLFNRVSIRMALLVYSRNLPCLKEGIRLCKCRVIIYSIRWILVRVLRCFRFYLRLISFRINKTLNKKISCWRIKYCITKLKKSLERKFRAIVVKMHKLVDCRRKSR